MAARLLLLALAGPRAAAALLPGSLAPAAPGSLAPAASASLALGRATPGPMAHARGCRLVTAARGCRPGAFSRSVQMNLSSSERRAAEQQRRAAARAEKEVERERMLKRRKAGLATLKVMAEFSRKKQQWKEEEAKEIQGRMTGAKTNVRSSPPASTESPNEMISLLSTYRDLAMTKTQLSVLKTVNDIQQAASNVTKQFKGPR